VSGEEILPANREVAMKSKSIRKSKKVAKVSAPSNKAAKPSPARKTPRLIANHNEVLLVL
jgi:hypothetical protein